MRAEFFIGNFKICREKSHAPDVRVKPFTRRSTSAKRNFGIQTPPGSGKLGGGEGRCTCAQENLGKVKSLNAHTHEDARKTHQEKITVRGEIGVVRFARARALNWRTRNRLGMCIGFWNCVTK